jgi:hypothetical protein
MSDPIRAALEAAAKETTDAGKIAAFLRALPDWCLIPDVCAPPGHNFTLSVVVRNGVAAAVEEAARADQD